MESVESKLTKPHTSMGVEDGEVVVADWGLEDAQ